MVVIPAIDIKNGRCVRLLQGKMSEETVYSNDPSEMARKWFNMGAERLHIVDLDGAVGGRPVNLDAIRSVIEAVPIPIQLGGGIRDLQTIEKYLEIGIDQVILSTVAYKDPGLLEKACRLFPGRIILGIDARNGHVSIEGWVQDTDITPEKMAKRHEELGISAIIYTDILRDGMRSGPNIHATRDLAMAVDIPVIASGGISVIDDIAKLMGLADCGVTGMITGKALYEGTLDLKEAIALLKKNC